MYHQKKLYKGDKLKLKIRRKAPKENIEKEWTIEYSNKEELFRKLRKIDNEWIKETGILNFTQTSILSG